MTVQITDKQLSAVLESPCNKKSLTCYLLYGAVDNYTRREVITGKTRTIGLKEGGVSLAKNVYYKEIVPQAIQDEIDELERKIIAGEIEVPTVRPPIADDRKYVPPSEPDKP
jgi:basic membrane protein A